MGFDIQRIKIKSREGGKERGRRSGRGEGGRGERERLNRHLIHAFKLKRMNPLHNIQINFFVLTTFLHTLFNPQKTGIGEIIAIFWTINNPPGLQGLMVGEIHRKKGTKDSPS